MSLLYNHDDDVSFWVSKKVGQEFNPPFSAIGVLSRDGRLIGGFVFNTFKQESVSMSIAGSGVFRRNVWAAVINYVFNQLGCVRLEIQTKRSNKIVKKLAPKLGFHFEGTARRYYGNEDGFVYSLTKDDLPGFFRRWGIKNGN